MKLFIPLPLHSDEVLILPFASNPTNPYKGAGESDHTFKLFSEMSSNSNFFNTAKCQRSDKSPNRREDSPLSNFSCERLIIYLSFGEWVKLC